MCSCGIDQRQKCGIARAPEGIGENGTIRLRERPILDKVHGIAQVSADILPIGLGNGRQDEPLAQGEGMPPWARPAS